MLLPIDDHLLIYGCVAANADRLLPLHLTKFCSCVLIYLEAELDNLAAVVIIPFHEVFTG